MKIFAVALLSAITLFPQSPDVTMRSLSGGAVKPGSQRGKIVVMSFGSTNVPISAKEMPALQKLADRYSSRGVQFYWVSVNSDKSGTRSYASDGDLQSFAAKHNVHLPILRDTDQVAYKAYGLEGLPALVIIDRNGDVARKIVGFGTDQGDSYVGAAKEIEQLLK